MGAGTRALKLLVVAGVTFVLSRIVALVPLVGLPPFPYLIAGYIGGRAAQNRIAGLVVGGVAALMHLSLHVYTLLIIDQSAPTAGAVTTAVLLHLFAGLLVLPLAAMFGGRW